MRIEFVTTLTQVDPAQWNSLWRGDYPFVRHEFLAALESSGCTSVDNGWNPEHCVVFEGERPIAAMPLYAKSHSYGEYVFDWSWANAFHENGFDYYPKLLNAIPFTPATGPRWTVCAELSCQQQQEVLQQMISAVMQRVSERGYSSFHTLFNSAAQRQQLQSVRLPSMLRARLDCQFHWFNQDFRSFDDFLATFSARKRKNVNKERRRVAEQNIEVQMVEGPNLTDEDWRHFYLLYQRTYLKRSGHGGYLNQSFFDLLGRHLAGSVVMAKATREHQFVAAALYLRDRDTLYGRYWGAVEEFDGLHFECCYYQGIEYAIANGLQRFDPGAQGEHKIARGFTPVLTGSAHYIAHPGFDRAIDDFLRQERQHVERYCQQAREELPFKEGYPVVDARALIGAAIPAPI